MHSLSLIKIHFSHLTLLSFNWVLHVSNLFNLGISSNSVKMLLLSMQLTNEKIIWKKKFKHKKSIKYFFIKFIIFSFEKNNFFNGKILTKLEGMPELNKFVAEKTQLNRSKIRRLKWILVKLRECNLHFSVSFSKKI